MSSIQSIADEINKKSGSYNIGVLQDLRKTLKGLSRRPGNSIFSSQTIFPDYAFHHGGRTELQFNIGFDGSRGKSLRQGIAFSFETNQTLPNLDVLRPKVRLFNEFLDLNPKQYSGMRMWHFNAGKRSQNYSPSAIPPERVVNKVFVFLGVLRAIGRIDYDEILQDFDNLLPLYMYVESHGIASPTIVLDPSPFEFVGGCTVEKLNTTAKMASDPVDVSLRHNLLQLKLYKLLAAEFGAKNVGTEIPTGNGTRVDVAVKRQTEYWFYEIKTYHSPRACIRDALGQLLEYSHWPNGMQAARLIVVGEQPLDADGQVYLTTLKSQYSLPIEYRRVRP